MKKLLIYNDKGVDRVSFRLLFHALVFLKTKFFIVEEVSHPFFLTNEWEKDTALIVFPGGRDLPYHFCLQGQANQRIKYYVQNGGRFLGICAGGYYGSAYIEFEKGGELEICGKRELGFFRGKAVGPAYGNGFFSYDSNQGVRAAHILWKQRTSFVYYNGGCFFENADADPLVQVVARYGDLPKTPAAAVYCSYGNGAALLMGIHPEYNAHDPFFKYIINKILI